MKKSVYWIKATVLSIIVVICVILISFYLQKYAINEVQANPPEAITSLVEERFGVEKDWQQNGKENLYTTKLLEGELASESSGVIKTDTDCEADERRISQCHNQIELDNGQTITVINIHNMRNYACFNPGEKVKIIPSEDGKWMTLSKIPS
ncbi:hypothetical protein [Brevibacillus laterosporus]|uniref:Uncharacterized protein n=1 Tax=Brevibacillus laterosporus TaxID=1465 RepID=A0AAP3DM45_BRELA|nr:hypothetical protein [Brevibacillus laterosporus]MCR8982524.1 hypothetical protein [Brevibacillus laterosporus]MCZ0809680.1 hypothetical protein [Brevibacillus laterosporus]MCZ0828213.1 hypothetical protein [Brevibacillus laterosporus]MCZ0852235.1 hypothetical protein [Brevibacillus laterosporus]